ncbi:MAG: VWA domain-containing protein [Xanthomonadales bacterium]|nr:VWA domain-containing protein [Xanthomonadales bacterium]NIN60305.1 VWA domain-containing protein [Xanthomonadales bacterium]NIN75657.1 VWA domain-containing protein [Xanthomonadales bacterium]NIO14730.1 VWA domain-containing protein [Xanthomonadales bacterium]NIP12698.1 VWA domain-containing protein [Xanthomonadales bacterium]
MGEAEISTGFAVAWPWMLALLPLPWLLRWWLPEAPARGMSALRVPWYRSVAAGAEGWIRRPLLAAVATLAWLLLVAAAVRPQWVGEVDTLPVTGRDLLLAVDISGSMDTQDMVWENRAVNRLEVVRQVAGEFVQRRRGDRVGLILFGSRAYLQTPLTFDTETAATLLSESEIGLAGRETAIGDAIGLAVKRLREDAAADRVLILLTDGANTSGEVQPLQAAEFAAREGLTVYTVGVGADEMMVKDFFGSRLVNPSADLDEDTLRAIAERTGGRYFRARDAEGLAGIYRLLDELEPVESDVEAVRPVDELFYWPLGIAYLLALITLAVVLRPAGLRMRAA